MVVLPRGDLNQNESLAARCVQRFPDTLMRDGTPGRAVASFHAIRSTQHLVLGFVVVAWAAMVVMLAVSPDVRDVMSRRIPGAGGPVIIGFVGALSRFLAVLTIGVLRKWRWLFWLILVAFAAGVIRVPLAVLQLSGDMSPEGPAWYVLAQGVIGAIQVALAVAMFVAYRRSGPWGSF
jgi:hypothetical protein